jgi:hypothetical protein
LARSAWEQEEGTEVEATLYQTRGGAFFVGSCKQTGKANETHCSPRCTKIPTRDPGIAGSMQPRKIALTR